MTENSQSNDLYRVTSLGELGANLPVARAKSDGSLIKERGFSFFEWDMEVEEKIGKIQSKAKNLGSMVSQMMDLLLDQFCGEDFQSLPKDQRIVLLNQLDFPNMLYMYMYLRFEELGSEIRMDVSCPTCKKLNKDFVADLNDLEVHVKDEEHNRQQEYELTKPILMDGGYIVSSILYDVSKWDTMERATQDVAENPAKMKQLLFRSSILSGKAKDKEGNEKEYPVDLILKKLKKIDIEKISKAITDNNAGPSMGIKGNCVHCSAEFFRIIEWNYQFFFDSSL